MLKENFLTTEMRNEFGNFLTERHKLTKPCLDAYMYFPKNEEMVEFDEKNLKASTRRIFEGSVQYNHLEETKLKEIKDSIEKFNQKQNKNTSIKLNSLKNSQLLRFLYATSFDNSKTIEFLVSHLEWKKSKFPIEITEKIMEILNIGLIYIYGRDCRFRPIINISAKVYEKYKNTYSLQDIETSVVYLLEYIIDFLLIPGQIESWDVIIDLQDVYITSIPIELQKIFTVLQNHYPCRLFVMYIINISGNLDFLWSSIKPLLSTNTQKKIKLLKSTYTHELFAYINPMHVQKKLGGKANDLKDVFFPGCVPGNECLLPGEKKSNIILDYDSYKKLLKTKTRIAICPILETLSENNESDADDESDQDSDKSLVKEFTKTMNTNNKSKKLNLRSSTFNNIMSDGIVVNLNFTNSNNSKDVNNMKEICVPNEKLKSTKSFTEGLNNALNSYNPNNQPTSPTKSDKFNQFDIKEEKSSRKICCSLDKAQFSSCYII